MAFRFIHTADLHLDSPLKSLALRDQRLGAMIANATRQAFSRLVERCLHERVDALLIAGDLYDGEIRAMATVLFLGEQLRRLDAAGIKVFIIRGNHDTESAVTRHLALPANTSVFSSRGGVQRLESHGVAIHGVSFPRGRVEASLLPLFRAPVEGVANVGMLHTSLAGAVGHDVYAPVSVAELSRHGFDYWALGHIHKRQVHASVPAIVMPGMPQGRDIGEAGAKSATLVTIRDDRSVELAEIATSVVEFASLSVDVGAATRFEDLSHLFRSAFDAAGAATAADMLAIRLNCTGATALSFELRRDPERVAAQAEEAAMLNGRIAIDKLVVSALQLETKGTQDADPLNEIRRQLLRPAQETGAAGRRTLEEILKALPPAARGRFGASEAETAEILEALAREGIEDVLAVLQGGED